MDLDHDFRPSSTTGILHALLLSRPAAGKANASCRPFPFLREGRLISIANMRTKIKRYITFLLTHSQVITTYRKFSNFSNRSDNLCGTNENHDK